MATLTSVLHPDHGFHPIATTALEVPAGFEQCAVHLVYTLPPLVFVDKYELANHDQSYSFQFWGVSNLELPVFAVEQSDSILLVNVKRGTQVSVPLHLRCGRPGAGFEETRLGWPVGFLACPASVQGPTPTDLPKQVAELFTQPVSLVSITPTSNEAHILRVPVARPRDLAFVEFATALSIFLFFWYLFRVVERVAVRLNSNSEKPE